MDIFSTHLTSNVKVVDLHMIHEYSVPSSSHAWLGKPKFQQAPDNLKGVYSLIICPILGKSRVSYFVLLNKREKKISSSFIGAVRESNCETYPKNKYLFPEHLTIF